MPSLDQSVYVRCPHCGTRREKHGKYWTILKRGKERNGLARFLCRSCDTWFNERSGEHLGWLSRE